jgi:hypothetical protein
VSGVNAHLIGMATVDWVYSVSPFLRSIQPFSKMISVVAGVILFGAWLLEKLFVDRANKLRDLVAKAEAEKDATERSAQIENRLIELYQVAASARDYSQQALNQARSNYLDRLQADIEQLERAGVSRNLAHALDRYASKGKRPLELIRPPQDVRKPVADATEAAQEFREEVDRRWKTYQSEQKSIVGDVINPNVVTEKQAEQLSAAIHNLRNEVNFGLSPRLAPIANGVYRALDELFRYANSLLAKRTRRAVQMRWVQLAVYILGAILAIIGAYLDATKAS